MWFSLSGLSEISGSVSRANTVEMFSAKDSNNSDPYNEDYRNYVGNRTLYNYVGNRTLYNYVGNRTLCIAMYIIVL